MSLLQETESTPVTGVSFRDCVPHVLGVAVDRTKAIALFEFLSGERFQNWRALVGTRKPDSYLREASLEERRVNDTVKGFLSAIAFMLDLPSDVLSFTTPDGRDVDVDRIDWTNLGVALRGPSNPNGWDPPVPRLSERKGD